MRRLSLFCIAALLAFLLWVTLWPDVDPLLRYHCLRHAGLLKRVQGNDLTALIDHRWTCIQPSKED